MKRQGATQPENTGGRPREPSGALLARSRSARGAYRPEMKEMGVGGGNENGENLSVLPLPRCGTTRFKPPLGQCRLLGSRQNRSRLRRGYLAATVTAANLSVPMLTRVSSPARTVTFSLAVSF